MDICVTVPKERWAEWITEGDDAPKAGTGVWTPEEYDFALKPAELPHIRPGERVYIVSWGKLRGYAPLTRALGKAWNYHLIRRGGAVAVTIDQEIRGFSGWRYRWWDVTQEQPFPDWKHDGVGQAVDKRQVSLW